MTDPAPTFDIPKEGWGAVVVRDEVPPSSYWRELTSVAEE